MIRNEKKNHMLLFYITFPSKNEATKIIEKLIQENHIACANILSSGTSLFKWKGKLKKGKETFCILKTSNLKKRSFLRRIALLHPYDIPCLVELKTTSINSAYKKWLLQELG